ncbi:MAG: beta-ketoacyl reductase, partial [Gaiellales bacterium]
MLVTGGTGALGALVARHLASQGAKHLLLTSRRGAKAEGAKELKAELKALGAKATITACDASERDQLADLLNSITKAHPLGAVIHTAGVLDDGVIESLDDERLDRVLAPKLDAAWHLHELTKGLDLQAFVLFSSVAATWGGPGQANYAAANAFLDSLARHRRAQGLAAHSIAWGLWQKASGMTGELGEADLARMARLGIAPLSDQQGLELFDQARTIDEPFLVAARLDTPALRAQARSGMLPALLRGLVRAPARRSQDTGQLARQLAELPEAEREQAVLALVRTHVAAVLGHASPEQVDPKRAFKELGFDSLGAVELRNRLSQATGLRLPSTLVFDYPSSVEVAGYLREQVEGK